MQFLLTELQFLFIFTYVNKWVTIMVDLNELRKTLETKFPSVGTDSGWLVEQDFDSVFMWANGRPTLTFYSKLVAEDNVVSMKVELNLEKLTTDERNSDLVKFVLEQLEQEV